METYQVGLISLAILLLLVSLVIFSWRRKAKQQNLSIKAPTFLEHQENGLRCLYVATVFTNQPLQRLVAHGLTHRGFASVAIEPEGIAIYRVGEKSFLIPWSDYLNQDQASAVIDKAVENDGLVVLNWRLGTEFISTYLRFASTKNQLEFKSQLSERTESIK